MKQKLAATACVAGCVAACGSQPTPSGLNEPLQVQSAQFFHGPLPGSPPLSAIDVKSGVQPANPRVTSFTFAGGGLHPGSTNNALQGRASTDAAAVALAFEDAGSGYWVLPVSGPDPSFESEYDWSLVFDLGASLAPGLRDLRMAAIDLSGNAGTQQSLPLCIDSLVPDNANACLPSRSPPNTVISLSWDQSVDLDLQVLTPAGKLVNAKHPTSAEPDANGKLDISASDVGTIQHDGGLGCSAAGGLREDLVFQGAPPPGQYLIYANLYDPCRASSVRFDLSIWVAAPAEQDGTFQQIKSFDMTGIELAVQANQASTRGQFLTALSAF